MQDYYQLGIYAIDENIAEYYCSFQGSGVAAETSLALNPRSAVSPAWDKLVFEILAKSFNLPIAETRAIYRPCGSFPSHVQSQLKSVEALRDYLTESESLPVFMKPVHTQKGIGGVLVNSYDPVLKQFDVIGLGRLTFNELILNAIDNPNREFYRPEAGYLVQSVIRQHHELTEFTGTEVPSGLRIVVQNGQGSGPVIHRCIWKLVRPGNHGDNFVRGTSGNMVCAIDNHTGEVSPAVTAFWPGSQWLEAHPVCGQRFDNFKIPFWDTIRAEVLRASIAFSPMQLLHWDVIVSDSGPVFLELNDLGGLDFLQLHGRGILDSSMREFIKNYGSLKQAPRLAKLLRKA